MARKKPHEEHENHERWLVSYADFITLLFAFFVVMYSTSSVNEGKMRVLSDSLIASFAGRTKSLSPIQIGKLVRSPYTDDVSPLTSPTQYIIVAPPEPVHGTAERGESALEQNDGFLGGDLNTPVGDGNADPPGAGAPRGGHAGGIDSIFGSDEDGPGAASGAAAADGGTSGPDPGLADVSEIANTVKESMAPLIDISTVALKQRKSWLEIELDSAKLFVSGSARLARDAIPVLSQLARTLQRFSNPIQVEGFTDNRPIRTLSFPSNWELSAARAASVVHLFTKLGVDPKRMTAIGYGEHRPVASNATAAGRAKNRRVVIVVPADAEIRRLLDADGAVGVTKGG